MKNNSPDPIRGKSLDAMTTAQLNEILQNEQNADGDMNVELIKEVIAVLDSRAETESVDVDAAWEKFVHNHSTSFPQEATAETDKGRRKKHSIRSLVLVAAVLVVLVVAVSVPAVASGHGVWNTIVTWSSETFGFSFGQDDAALHIMNPEYAELRQALDVAGVSTPLVPKYLPDGYTQDEFYTDVGWYTAVYRKGDYSIIIRIQDAFEDLGTQFEQNNETPEQYVFEGIEHFIIKNKEDYSVAWTNAGYECSIMGVPSEDELYKMIDSIYLEEKQ